MIYYYVLKHQHMLYRIAESVSGDKTMLFPLNYYNKGKWQNTYLAAEEVMSDCTMLSQRDAAQLMPEAFYPERSIYFYYTLPTIVGDENLYRVSDDEVEFFNGSNWTPSKVYDDSIALCRQKAIQVCATYVRSQYPKALAVTKHATK